MTAPTTTADPATPMTSADYQRVYWHRELPPLNADIMGEHVLEAQRVGGCWDRSRTETSCGIAATATSSRTPASDSRKRSIDWVVATHTCSTSTSTAATMTSPEKPGCVAVSPTSCIAENLGPWRNELTGLSSGRFSRCRSRLQLPLEQCGRGRRHSAHALPEFAIGSVDVVGQRITADTRLMSQIP